ncbi:MAG: DUF2398 family protein, partial [Gammaproteobacteria bacterium]|nr:DUF2398 family protein [Gammaproteobacteria bacterium]
MPAEGTEAHATLLVAEFLSQRLRSSSLPAATTLDTIASHLCNVRAQFGKYWRKSARAPGAEQELAGIAIDRLRKLQLVALENDRISALPALGESDIRITDS